VDFYNSKYRENETAAMMSLLVVIGIGFLLGMRHAIDPDHVVAVTTIVSRQRNIWRAGWVGVVWGVGHTITIVAVGAAIILFDLAIPTRVGLAMELTVGLMLILLGMLNLTGVTQWITDRFTSGHSHEPAVRAQRIGSYQFIRPLAVGIVHGLAGSAAVALLVLTTIRDVRWAVIYLLVFGVGTIGGMMVITMIIGVPFAYTGKRFSSFNRALVVGSGIISVAFGLFITLRIGFIDGLFTAHPHWTPN
jgi:ABC-type nickel/cobalt efflux system permease component RcnA